MQRRSYAAVGARQRVGGGCEPMPSTEGSLPPEQALPTPLGASSEARAAPLPAMDLSESERDALPISESGWYRDVFRP